ncbi:hypothetical protein MNQ98_24790 [Paenibacillus sp. N3/727]|uniref:hypothetical protein n=1 Tax=Paenibacillus sp. N3/727 TaxID=2925845 RepID=UPI001F532792|nr:hypothetical protein [Paenibacillus sp. N3/727]UNK17639.1 hypothetical protein MNQ98_24790 [Paenibacillus sp. N3/727]
MRKLSFNQDIYEAERIVKTDTDIIGYNGKNEIFAFRGISDFSIFELDGEFDIENDELVALRADNEKLKTQLAEAQAATLELHESQAMQDAKITEANNATFELYELIAQGGTV